MLLLFIVKHFSSAGVCYATDCDCGMVVIRDEMYNKTNIACGWSPHVLRFLRVNVCVFAGNVIQHGPFLFIQSKFNIKRPFVKRGSSSFHLLFLLRGNS